MKTIHAHKRTKAYSTTIVALSAKVDFVANEHGDFVANVARSDVIDWLLKTPTGFKVYEPPADAPVAPLRTVANSKATANKRADADSKYVLKSADSELDLRPLTDDQLRAFCDANKVALAPADTGDTIRDKIVAEIGA